MLYFAYGSNMHWEQIVERCPSARIVGIAALPDHRLAFTRGSISRRCGVADAVPVPGAVVWGVVYEIGESDVATLDAAEGYRPGRDRNAYWRQECQVLLGADEARPLAVAIYLAEKQPNPPRPNQAYKELIVAGARHWHLPAAYVAELERIEADP